MSWYSAGAMGTGRSPSRSHVIGGKVYVTGGTPGTVNAYGDTVPNLRVDEYTPGTNTWTQKASMSNDMYETTPGGYLGYTSQAVCGGGIHHHIGYIHLMGGGENRHWRFVPGANTWTRVADFPQFGNYTFLSGVPGGADDRMWTLGSGEVWGSANDENAAYRYNASTNTWTYLGSFNGGASMYQQHTTNKLWFLSARGATGYFVTYYLETFDLTNNSVTQGGTGPYSLPTMAHYIPSRGLYYEWAPAGAYNAAGFTRYTTSLGGASVGGSKGGGGPSYGGNVAAGIGEDMYVIGGFADPIYYATAWRWNPTFPTPNTVTPVQGATVNTDLPNVGLTIVNAGGEKQRGQWQLARDSGFGTSLRTVDESEGDYSNPGDWRVDGPTLEAILAGSAQELFQGTWWLRGRTVNGTDQYSAWTGAQSFAVDHKPSAATVSPVGDQTLDYAGSGTVTFSWSFSDTSPTDFQSAYQVIAERNDTGALVFDTGKVASQNARSYTYNFAAAQKDVQLRWKVRVWDSDDITAGYSNYALFRVSDKPVANVTAPAEGSTTAFSNPTVTWTFTASGGRTQASYRVRFWQSGAVIHDTGIVSGPATSYTPESAVLGPGGFTVQVDVTDNVGLAGTDSNTFNVSFVPPSSPAFTLDPSRYESDGFIRVTWTNAGKDAQWQGWRVRRRIAGSGATPTLVYSTTVDQSNYTFDDYGAGSGVTYEYFVVQVASRGGIGAESVYNNGQTTTGQSTKYWLLHPTDPTKNILLQMVTAEDFSDEYESETMNLIGRGRKVDYGTHLGYKGTLTAQLRNTTGGKTARTQRMDLEAIKRRREQIYLRNPFGDVFLVDLGNLSFGRIAGVGMHEAIDVSIPYEEIK